MRDLQTKHLAEKRLIENDIVSYRQIVKRLVSKYKLLLKQKQKQDISLLLMSKLQEANKTLKAHTEDLSVTNLNLSRRFGLMKQLVVDYEE